MSDRKVELEEAIIEAIAKHLNTTPLSGDNVVYKDIAPYLDERMASEDAKTMFEDVVFWMKEEGYVKHSDLGSGTENEVIFYDLRLTPIGREALARHLQPESATPSDGKANAHRLNEMKNGVILHLYEYGAGNLNFEMNADDVRSALDISLEDFRKVRHLLFSQGHLPSQMSLKGIGLSATGQQEAERLGPTTPLRAPTKDGQTIIHTNYSLVQVAGHNSSQVATQNIDQSRFTQTLNDIESAIPALDINDVEKEEAEGLLNALRGYAGKALDAAGRAIAAALAGILKSAGSALGQRLLELLAIAV